MGLDILSKIFDAAEQTEQLLGDYYASIAVALDHEDWKKFWAGLAKEEINHKNMLTMQERILIKSKETGDFTADDLAKIRSLLKTVAEIVAACPVCADQPLEGRQDVEQIFEAAMQLEKTAERVHTNEIFRGKDANLIKLFEQLAMADRNHLQRIKDFHPTFMPTLD